MRVTQKGLGLQTYMSHGKAASVVCDPAIIDKSPDLTREM
jgi:hypothetical protein